MTEHKTLAAALAAVQAHMPSVHKGKTANVGQYKYTYADLADVSAAILPLLSDNGLAFTCHPRRHEGGAYELAASLMHTSGDAIEGALPIIGTQPQQIGSAITYARRYLLGCLTGIVTDDDEDGAFASRPTPTPQAKAKAPEKPMSDGTRKRMFALFSERGIGDADQLPGINQVTGKAYESRADLTEADARLVIDNLTGATDG